MEIEGTANKIDNNDGYSVVEIFRATFSLSLVRQI